MSWFTTKETFLALFCPFKPTYLPEHYPDLSGQYFLVTGTSAGIGGEVTKLLLSKNATVVQVNRSIEKTAKVNEKVFHELIKDGFKEEDLEKRIVVVRADLADLTTIKAAASTILSSVPHLDSVILNAGVMQPPLGSLTTQGYELQFGANVMGHQLLLELINPAVLKSAELGHKPRVIFVSSMAHLSAPPNGGLTWKFNATSPAGMSLYGQSKAGNVYQASYYGRQWADKGITSLALHPGCLETELQRHFPGWITTLLNVVLYPAVYGAYTELFSALSPEAAARGPGFAGYVSAFGEFRDLRPDIAKGTEDGTDEKLINWIDQEIAQYK